MNDEKKPKERVALRINSARGIEKKDYQSEHGVMYLGFCLLEPNGEAKLSTSLWPDDWPFRDLMFRCQWDKNRPDPPYGWELRYHDVYDLGLREAEVMVKMLRRVRMVADRLPVQPQSFGQYVQLMCQALGVKEMWVSNKQDEELHTVKPIRECQFLLDQAVIDAREPKKEVVS